MHSRATVIDITARKGAESEARTRAGQLQAISQRVVQLQESERRDLSAELHDLLGQDLVAIILNLHLIREQLPAKVLAKIDPRLDDSVAWVERTVEAVSLASHMKLDRSCWIYDANRISIEGSTAITFTEDVGARFEAYGRQAGHAADANDLAVITHGLLACVDRVDRPALLFVHRHMAYGAPHKHDTREAHGEPLGTEDARLAKQAYGFDPDAQFAIPDGVPAQFDVQFGARGRQARAAWNALFDAYRAHYPELAAQIERIQRRGLPAGRDAALPRFAADLANEFGNPVAERVEAPASPEQKARLAAMSPRQVASTELAGEKIQSVLSKAPDNGAPISGIKVIAANGWFAARPSGTEDIYKIYAESFAGPQNLQRLLEESQATVDAAISTSSGSGEA